MLNQYFIGITGMQAEAAAHLLWEDYGFFTLEFEFFGENWGVALQELGEASHIVTPIRSDEEAAQVVGAGGVLIHIGDGEAAGDVLRAYFAEHGEPEQVVYEAMPDEELSVAELFEEIDEYVSALAFAVYDLLPRNRPDPIEETLGVLSKRLEELRGRALGAPVAEAAATH
ncbi:MAG: hypothetical protein KF710_04780 [Rhodocyclaceae bacterium]|nr:hypothetical protein [Rhodocyclaceae bacterium]